MECHYFRLKKVTVVVLRCHDMDVCFVFGTKPPPVLAISLNFSSVGKRVCSGNKSVSATAQKSCTHWHTVVMLTQKKCPMLLYSEPVVSFHGAIDTLFFRGTHQQKFMSRRSITGHSYCGGNLVFLLTS